MEKKLQKTISYTLQFIDSTRVMVSLSSNLVYNFSEAIHRTKCNSEMTIKNLKYVELNISIATVFLNIQT